VETAAKPLVRLRTRVRKGGFTAVPSRSASDSPASILCARAGSNTVRGGMDDLAREAHMETPTQQSIYTAHA